MSPSGAVLVVPVVDEPTRASAYAIRFEVFVDEQGVPRELELDELDDVADHVLVLVDGFAAATGRLVVEAPGFEGLDVEAGPVAHLGRIAVRAAHRGFGLGATVVRALEERAVDAGLRVAYLEAQVVALEFYAKLGYTLLAGPPHDSAGIPHRHMTRPLP